MAQLRSITVFNKILSVNPVDDYPPNSLLILTKVDANNVGPNGECLQIKYFDLKTGTKSEYFSIMAEYPDFGYYTLVHGELEAGEIKNYKAEFEQYAKVGDIIYSPQQSVPENSFT